MITVPESGQARGSLDVAQATLNRLILELFLRTRIDPTRRASHLGQALVIETPDQAAQVLDHPDIFAKNFALVAAFGPSRFNLNGKAWSDMRPRTQRVYARAGRPVMQGEIAAIYAAELDSAKPDVRSIEQALARAALRVFFRAFGVDPDVSPFLTHFATLREIAVQLQYLSWVGGDPATQAGVEALAATALQDFQSLCGGHPIMLGLLARLAQQSPPLAAADMAADFMTNMFAGIETTTAAISWMIEAMGRSGDLQAALRRDARTGEAALLNSFRDECLRMFSPIPFVVRQATEATRLGGAALARGDLVLVSLVGLHRDPGFWTSPLEFHAARAEFASDAAPNPAFRPFLTGPRACGGRRLAELELNAALRLLVSRYQFASLTAEPDFTYALAFRPRLTPLHHVAVLT